MRRFGKFLVLLISICLLVLVSCDHEVKLTPQEELNARLIQYKIITPSEPNKYITPGASKISYCFGTVVDGVMEHPEIASDTCADTSKEIDLGHTNRTQSLICAAGLGPFDYTIRVFSDGRIVIVGGSVLADAAAADKFVQMCKDGTFDDQKESTYTYRFFESHPVDPLCNVDSTQAKAFISSWKSKNTSPEWGGIDRDIKESIYALTHKKTATNGRIAVFAHRGDMGHYPENSLAGIMSAILSGADTIEFDFRLTKDYIPIIFHDATLSRTTDWNSKKGKNGLPTSENVSDWTYDQLLQLNLLDYSKNVTSYKIATVYEGLKLATGRIQVSFDDKSNTGLGLEGLYIPLAKTAGAGSSLILQVCRSGESLNLLNGMISSDLKSFANSYKNLFISCSAFYNIDSGSIFESAKFASNYESLNEDSSTWDYIVGKGRRFVGTNRCYELSVYMRDNGMKAWNY